MLFKAEQRNTGEDWAEKVSCQLCELLGLPHVHYELAEEYDGGQCVGRGVVCKDFVPPWFFLILGNQLLLQRDPAYPAAGRKYKVHQHTVDAVARVVRPLAPPGAESIPPGIVTALDVFVGYLMLDAWIANQDRHHENWGALVSGDELRLAPTFDHGASLARNITDEERIERLTTRDRNRTVAYFASRARSAFYGATAGARPLITFEAYAAMAALAPEAGRIWTEQLGRVDGASVRSILDEVPGNRMSRPAREFTIQLLRVNQEHLLQRVPT
jgi:hypothetical protein